MDRQKIVIVFGIALISAAALTWFLYANTVAPKAEKRTVVIAAARDLPVGNQLIPAQLRRVALGTADVPKGAIFTVKDAVGRVLLYPLNANEPLTLAKLSGQNTPEGIASTIQAGYRAVSVQITEVSGVAGFLQPHSHVDVVFTRPGSMAEATTSTILQNVEVLALGRTVAMGAATGADPKQPPKISVATLLLKPAEAQKLELAKNEGKISLTLRNPLDNADAANPGVMTTDVLDPVVSARIARARRGRTTNLAGTYNLDDPKVWQELTGEKKPQDEKPKVEKPEPPKPRAVVDVFRGNKHVQEMFR